MEKPKKDKKTVKKVAVKKVVVKKTAVKPAPAKKAEVKHSDPVAYTAYRVQPIVAPKTPVVAAVQSAPYHAPAPAPAHPQHENYWQEQYQDDRLVLMIRDPYWCFTYWDLSEGKRGYIRREVDGSGRQTKLVLRVYDVTDVIFDGNNAHRHQDLEVSDEAANWYINVWEASRSYCVELGLLYADGRFTMLLRSNVVATPRDSVSPVIDEEWMVVDETFDRLYQSAGAGDIGRSSEAITKYMLKRLRADVTSGGFASMGSEGGRPKPRVPEDFWLVVHTELIVYGATEPTAKVTIQDKPQRLNPDGTFSVRFALPDGKQTIPVKAVNATGSQERKITPIVEKQTQ